jgi:hypothetical protein
MDASKGQACGEAAQSVAQQKAQAHYQAPSTCNCTIYLLPHTISPLALELHMNLERDEGK